MQEKLENYIFQTWTNFCKNREKREILLNMYVLYRKNTAMLIYVHPINRALKNTDGYGYHSSECQ